MNVLWYVRRLQRMTPAEILARSRDASVKVRWRRRQVPDHKILAPGSNFETRIALLGRLVSVFLV